MAREHVARIGTGMRLRREELGLTQRELADLLPGKSDSNQVSKWERGEHRPNDETLEHIALALKVDVSHFHAPAPTGGPADLLGALARNDRDEQLDRIEAKLDAVLATLPGVSPDVLFEREIADAVRSSERRGSGSATGGRGRKRKVL